MRKAIWKYTLPQHGTIDLDIPTESFFLHVEAQYNEVVAWFMVDPTENTFESRRFRVVQTGEEFVVDADYRGYYGTVLLDGGSYVVHVLELFPR